MTNSSINRIVAAISDSAICVGLANWLAIPSNASARQISFRINLVAISIVATYSNNTISRNEAVGAIQFMNASLKTVRHVQMPPSKRVGGADSDAPLWGQMPVL